MSTIIKASDSRGVSATASFNFDDLTAQANRYLEKIRAEAAKILSDARQQAQREADAIRKRAAADGAEDARRAAVQSIDAILAAKIAPAMPALRQAAQDIHLAKQSLLNRWESSALQIAFAISRRIIRSELSRRPEISLALVRESLELAVGSAKLRIQLNPSDHTAMGKQVDMLAKELMPAAEIEIIAEPGVAPGGCRVETEFGAIDQQIESQLARIEEELA